MKGGKGEWEMGRLRLRVTQWELRETQWLKKMNMKIFFSAKSSNPPLPPPGRGTT
jgi:hypothetical protein